MNFFYLKELEIGYVLMFSSVRYRLTEIIKPTNFSIESFIYSTESFIYHHLHAHRISPPQK